METFDDKLRFFGKQIAWIIVFLMMLPICMWGIYLGYQYRNDKCVRETPTTLALDWWLVAACVYDLFFAVVVLVLLCCHARRTCRGFVIIPMHVVNLVWMIIGIWLIVESQLRCPHNTLWVMSIVVVILTCGVMTSLLMIWLCSKLGGCRRLARYVALEDSPYNNIISYRGSGLPF